VVKTAKILCSLLAISWGFGPLPVLAQRVQFATPLESQPGSASPSMAAPLASPPVNSSPYSPLSSPPATFSQPNTTFAPRATPYSPGTYTPPPGTVAPPPATFSGATQPPVANWDPYAAPSNAPNALLPQDPYLQSSPQFSMASVQKFLQHVDFDYHWFAGHGVGELGINDLELSATFAFPMFYNSATPLLITPGFAVHYWEGPVSVRPVFPNDPWPADLPPRTYDAYLDAAWNPQITNWFSGELNFRIGVYSDFKRVTSGSIRYMGKGMAVLRLSPSIKIKAGVWYLDRNYIKILPAGCLCWTPNADIYFDILFPNPKVGKRLTTWGSTEWWLYVSGDYGGGNWSITRNSGLEPPIATDGTYDTFDYNDIRFALGLEFNTLRQLHGMFEVGLAFDRELRYQSGLPVLYRPNNTVFLRAGLAY